MVTYLLIVGEEDGSCDENIIFPIQTDEGVSEDMLWKRFTALHPECIGDFTDGNGNLLAGWFYVFEPSYLYTCPEV